MTWSLQPCQNTEGRESVITDGSYVLARIESPVWDIEAEAVDPRDVQAALLMTAARDMFDMLKAIAGLPNAMLDIGRAGLWDQFQAVLARAENGDQPTRRPSTSSIRAAEGSRDFVERVAGLRTLHDQFRADSPEGEQLRNDYENVDDYRSDLGEERLSAELGKLEGLIHDARQILVREPADPLHRNASKLLGFVAEVARRDPVFAKGSGKAEIVEAQTLLAEAEGRRMGRPLTPKCRVRFSGSFAPTFRGRQGTFLRIDPQSGFAIVMFDGDARESKAAPINLERLD
ncbi:hypothetical protein [uncultured Bosea sp.]|uniref:hypothetical protein n=1 Tax=uncultured Bosea sp. TaxID=211457 RepID=UPI0025F7C13E|nr:hypothetical protein [uncultured Bosea sp.]